MDYIIRFFLLLIVSVIAVNSKPFESFTFFTSYRLLLVLFFVCVVPIPIHYCFR